MSGASSWSAWISSPQRGTGVRVFRCSFLRLLGTRAETIIGLPVQVRLFGAEGNADTYGCSMLGF